MWSVALGGSALREKEEGDQASTFVCKKGTKLLCTSSVAVVDGDEADDTRLNPCNATAAKLLVGQLR